MHVIILFSNFLHWYFFLLCTSYIWSISDKFNIQTSGFIKIWIEGNFFRMGRKWSEQLFRRGSWWQNDAKSWHLGISWELNKAFNLSLSTHFFFFFFFFFIKVFSGLYFDILTSPNQDYFFVNRDSICLYLLFKEILKIIFLIIKVI